MQPESLSEGQPQTPSDPYGSMSSPESNQPTPPTEQQPVEPPSAPEQPFTGPVTVSPPPSFTPPASPHSPIIMETPRSKKGIWLSAIVLLIAIGVGVGTVFDLYLPNTPGHIYSASLTNSGKALDKLIDYSKKQQEANYKSASFDGAVHVKSAQGSYDINLTGAADNNGNANVQLNADVLGEKISTNVRSVHVADNTSPDIYLQVNGAQTILDQLGLNTLDSLNGKWIAVDHTIIDTYVSSLKQDLNSSTKMDNTVNQAPTSAQLEDAIAKVQTVNKQYVFTTDSTKAVLANEKFVAQETQGGHKVDRYKVGYSKTHLEAYATALARALDSSQLNDWSKKVSNGQNLSDAMNFSSLQSDIRNAKSNYTFDLWADTSTKLVTKLSFTDPSDSSSVFTVSQGYTGGTQYPFTISLTGKDNGTPSNGSLGLTIDTKTQKTAVTFSGTASDTTVTGNLSITPSNNTVTVTAPTGAESIIDVLNSLGLGSLTSGNLFDSSASPLSSQLLTQ